jgi:transcriptional regulator with XRE-family HTH domain
MTLYDKTPPRILHPAQIRASRALLDWTQRDLARAAGISLSSVSGFESGPTKSPLAFMRIVDALMEVGIHFIEVEGGYGVVYQDQGHGTAKQ